MEPQQPNDTNPSTKEKRSSFFNGDYKINRWPADTNQAQGEQAALVKEARPADEGKGPDS